MKKEKTLFEYTIDEYKHEQKEEMIRTCKDYLPHSIMDWVSVLVGLMVSEAYALGRIDKEKEERC